MTTSILDFHQNKPVHPSGYLLNDILYKWHDDYWEDEHDFIQWLFPFKEPSEFNPDAPLLTDEDIAAGAEALNVSQCSNRFFAFLGIKWDGNIFSIQNNEKAYIRIKEFNHNHLRITRFLKFLCLLSCKELARKFVKFLSNYTPENASSLKFWQDAVK